MIPTTRKAKLVSPAAVGDGLFPGPATSTSTSAQVDRVSAGRVTGTSSRLLFDLLAGVYDGLGFSAVGDEVFRDLVISRIVEPTSILDTARVLSDLGRPLSGRPVTQPRQRFTPRRALRGPVQGSGMGRAQHNRGLAHLQGWALLHPS